MSLLPITYLRPTELINIMTTYRCYILRDYHDSAQIPRISVTTSTRGNGSPPPLSISRKTSTVDNTPPPTGRRHICMTPNSVYKSDLFQVPKIDMEKCVKIRVKYRRTFVASARRCTITLGPVGRCALPS